MTVKSDMEPHVRTTARRLLTDAANQMLATAGVLHDGRRKVREIREALEGHDRKSGLIGILADDAGDHWSVAGNLRGYALTLRSISKPDMKGAADNIDAAHAALQDNI